MPSDHTTQTKRVRRKRRRGGQRLYHSGRRSAYDWTILSLLLLSLLLGMVLFGGVAIWTTAPMVVLVAAAAVLACFRPFLAEEHRVLRLPPGFVGLALFGVYALLVMPYASVRYPAGMDVLKVGSYLLAYWTWCQVAGPNSRWRIVFGIFLLVVSLLCWYALILDSRGLAVVLDRARPEGYGMRASGTYICPNHFAHLLELGAVLALGLLVLRDSGPTLRILSGYTLALVLPVQLLTQSRSGWIGTAIGLSVTGFIVAAKRSRRLILGLAVGLPVLAALLAGALWVASPIVRDRVQGAASGEDGSVGFRLATWKDTIDMIEAAPLLGHGGGSYEWVYPRFRTHRMQWWFDYAHNEFLHVTSEYGLVGVLLLALCVGAVLFRFGGVWFRTRHPRETVLVAVVLGAVAASFSHALFDFNLHIFANVHTLIMIAGVAAARLYHEEVFTARQLKRSALVLLHGAVLLVGLAQVPPIVRAYLVDRYQEKGEALQSRLAYDEALAAFGRAVRWDPGYWKPYLGQADVYQTQSAWSLDADNRRTKADQAFEFYQMATERNPYDLDAYFGVSRAFEERGAADEAVKQMDAILVRAPRDSFYLEQAALQRKRLGRLREALDLFQRAYALTPSDATERNIGALRRELATP